MIDSDLAKKAFKVACYLDSVGCVKEADLIDSFVKKAAGQFRAEPGSASADVLLDRDIDALWRIIEKIFPNQRWIDLEGLSTKVHDNYVELRALKEDFALLDRIVSNR